MYGCLWQVRLYENRDTAKDTIERISEIQPLERQVHVDGYFHAVLWKTEESSPEIYICPPSTIQTILMSGE